MEAGCCQLIYVLIVAVVLLGPALLVFEVVSWFERRK